MNGLGFRVLPRKPLVLGTWYEDTVACKVKVVPVRRIPENTEPAHPLGRYSKHAGAKPKHFQPKRTNAWASACHMKSEECSASF